MRYDDLPESGNIEDRRDQGGYVGGGGFPGGFPIGGGGLGIGTIVVLGIIGWALGIDPRLLIGGAELINRQNTEFHGIPRIGAAGQEGRSERRDRPVRGSRPRQHRSGVERYFCARRQDLSPADCGPLFPHDIGALRRSSPKRYGPVLLPVRQENLSRYIVLPGTRDSLSWL
jgi:hypothetical protein